VTVVDKDPSGKDDVVGTFHLDINDLPFKSERDYRVDFLGGGGGGALCVAALVVVGRERPRRGVVDEPCVFWIDRVTKSMLNTVL
jgi:hypothetical protein